MVSISDISKMAEKIDFWQGSGTKDGYGMSEDETKAWGYDKNGELVFSAEYDKEGNFRLSLFSGKSGETRICEDLYSDDLNNPSASPSRRQKLNEAKLFITAIEKQNKKDNRENSSFAELLSKGTSVTLSEKSRLSFAPDIDRLWISKDKDGILHMTGMSKDGKQRIDFSHNAGIIQFELHDGETARSYNNKIGGKFTWRNLQSPTGTRYFDNQGENYAKELAQIVDKVKTQYKSRQQSNINTTDKISNKNNER